MPLASNLKLETTMKHSESLRNSFPIRYCTGGCKQPGHAPHIYSVDPVDGRLGFPYLCPGNTAPAREYLDPETGEPTGYGFIPAV